MKIEQSKKTDIKFTGEVYTNVYVSEYNKVVELSFRDTAADGTEHHFTLSVPISNAKELVKELSGDIVSYDEEVAAREAAKEAEAKESVDE